MSTWCHVGLNFISARKSSAILEFSLLAVNYQMNFYRYIKIVASITNFVFSSLISDSYVIHRGHFHIKQLLDPPPLTLLHLLPSRTHHPHYPLAEFCVQFLVTIPWVRPPCLAKIHLINKNILRNWISTFFRQGNMGFLLKHIGVEENILAISTEYSQ